MNYTDLASEMRQSDQIMRKLDQIKFAIEGRHQTSPTNLHQYLPQDRVGHHQHPINKFNTSMSGKLNGKEDGQGSPQSYRNSLEKRLERLFKEERKNFQDHQKSFQENQPAFANGPSLAIQVRFQGKQAFTIERMENKIKQLQRKYLNTSPEPTKKTAFTKKQQEQDTSIQNKKKQKTQQIPIKTHSVYDKPNNNTSKKKRELLADKSDRKLMLELGELKKEVRKIKESNLILNEKLEQKENTKKFKKERSRYLLQCILDKLMDIQQEVRRRDSKEQIRASRKNIVYKTAADERLSLKQQNNTLIRQVEELEQQLHREVNERERAEERKDWIENQLRKLNRM